MNRKNHLITFLLLLIAGIGHAQISLDYCLKKAGELSPLNKQNLQYQSVKLMTEKNLKTVYLPQFRVNAQATYQSDVFSFPNNPIMENPIIPKEQYKVTLDLSQTIYDGGMAKNKKIAENARITNDMYAVEVEIYQIKKTINDLFFGALLYQENLAIFQNLLADLNEQQKIISSRVINGVLPKISENNFKKQILSTEQQILSVSMDLRSILDILGKWIGEEIDDKATLVLTNNSEPDSGEALNRPEVSLFRSQQQYFEAMKNLAVVKRRPAIGAFAQAGFGSPNAYNWFETELSDFYYLGIRISWQITDYGSAKREKEIYQANENIIESKLKNFEEGIGKQLIKENAQIEKMGKLMEKDDEIITLQRKIVARTFSQLKNGVINTTEYLNVLTDLAKLEINREIHSIQLMQARHNRLTLLGNN